jgi:hypothetical protein
MADLTVDQLNEKLASTTEKLERIESALSKATGQTSSLGSSFLQASKQIGNGVTGFASAMANGQQGASAFNGVINASSQALGTVLQSAGLLGQSFVKLTEFSAEYITRANQQGDALFKSFQDLSKVGGAGADGMKGVFDNMQQFGLTMNQLPEFGAMIAQNSEALAVMGGTVSQGTKAFAGVASSIQQSGLQAEFERMGLTTKNINEGTANYLRIQTLTSAGAVKTQAQLNTGAEEYIRQQDKLSRLTGKSADALAKEAETRQANERYAAVSLELQMKADAARAAGDEAGAKAAEDQMKQNEELLSRTPAALKQGVMDLMSGFVNSPEAKKMYIALPEMSQAIISQNFKAAKVIDAGAKEADANTKRNIGLAKAGVNDAIQASYAGQRELSRLKGTESELAATTQATALAKGGDVDINNQVALRESQRATTMAMDNLVQKGVGPVTAGMRILATGIETVITKTIPKKYIGEKTSTSDTGRGTATPATAGYSTDFKPEDLMKFLEETVSKAVTALKSPDTLAPTRPPATTGGAARDALFGSNTTGPRTPVATPATTGAQARDALLGVPNTTGPNTTYRTNLGDTTPTNAPTAPASQESAARGNADLTQGIMTLAQNIGSQTTSMNELVELMRRSNGIQDRILQQARN